MASAWHINKPKFPYSLERERHREHNEPKHKHSKVKTLARKHSKLYSHQSSVLSKERSNIPPTLNYNCLIILFIFNLKLFLVMKNIYIQRTYTLFYMYAYVSKIMRKIEVNNKNLKNYSL